MKKTTEINVRGYHLDVYGHVNNARYLEFLEENRWEVFEQYDINKWALEGITFAVVNINISYKKPAVLGDILEIKSGIIKFSNKSCTMRQKVFRKNSQEVLAEADVTFVIIDAQGKTIVFSGEIREKLLPLMED
jgi:thioesterase-3